MFEVMPTLVGVPNNRRQTVVARAIITALVVAMVFSLLQNILPTLASGPSSNRILNYQIRLTDPNGIPVADGTKNIKITFYDAPTGGSQLHTDCSTDGLSSGTPAARKVVFAGGVGVVLIGDTAAAAAAQCAAAPTAPNAIPATLFDNPAVYIGITVSPDATEMTPRKRLVASGFALNSDKLDDLDSSATGGITGFIPATDAGGRLKLTADPTSTQAVITANPASAQISTNDLLLDLQNNSTSKFKVDAEGDTTVQGTIGIGTDPDPFADVYVNTTNSGVNAHYGGLYAVERTAATVDLTSSLGIISSYSGSTSSSGEIAGIYGGPSNDSNFTVDEVSAADLSAWNSADGTVTSLNGLKIDLQNFNAAANVTTAKGIALQGWGNGGTVGTSYGIYMDTGIDIGTTRYALYSSSTSNSYLQGNLGIGTATPSSFKLQVNGNVGPNTDNTYDLGSSALRWKTLHVGPGSVVVHNDATNTLKETLGFSGSTAQLITDAATPLQLTTGANVGLSVATTGNVGVNDATPAATFTVGPADVFQVAGATGNVTTSGDITATGGDITGAAGESLDIGEATLNTFTFSRNDTGAVSITSADNDANADLQIFAGGSGALTVGDTGSTTTFSGDSFNFLAAGAGGTPSTNDFLINLVDNNTNAFSIDQGGNTYLSIDTNNGAEATTLGNSSTATASTTIRSGSGSINLTPGGSGDTVISLDSDSNAQFISSAAPGISPIAMVLGTSSTDGVSGILLNFGASNANGNMISLTPSYAGGANDFRVYNGIEIAGFAPTNASGTDEVHGLRINTLTDPGATISSSALLIGSGWDDAIDIASPFTVRGMSAPPVSVSGTGRIYFDSGTNTFKVSENGAAYTTLVGGGGSSQWTTTGSDIFYSTGNVGIGTSTPHTSLELGDGKNLSLNSGFINSPFGGFGAIANFLNASEDFSSGAGWWSLNGGSSVAADTQVAPNGLTTADVLTIPNGGSVSQTGDFSTAGGGTTFTGSVWLKSTSGTVTINLRLNDNDNSETGTPSSKTVTTSWQRFSVTQVFASSTQHVKFFILNNSGASEDVVAWGGQLQRGTSAGPYARNGQDYSYLGHTDFGNQVGTGNQRGLVVSGDTVIGSLDNQDSSLPNDTLAINSAIISDLNFKAPASGNFVGYELRVLDSPADTEGGELKLITGRGGNGAGASAGQPGGQLDLVTGDAGDSGSGTAGDGGLFTLTSGNGGSSSGTPGAGGLLSLIAGTGGGGSGLATAGAGGDLKLFAGPGGFTSNSSAVEGVGGNVVIEAGPVGNPSGSIGAVHPHSGDINIGTEYYKSLAGSLTNFASTNAITIGADAQRAPVTFGGDKGIQTSFGGLGRFENGLKFSEDFTQSSVWILSGVSVSGSSCDFPSPATTSSSAGGATITNACLLDPTNGATMQQTATDYSAGSNSFVGSIWLFSDTPTTVTLRIDADTTGDTPEVVTVTSVWHRYVVRQNFSGATGSPKFTIEFSNTNSITAWGAQLEQDHSGSIPSGSSAGVYLPTRETSAPSMSHGLVVNSINDSLNNNGWSANVFNINNRQFDTVSTGSVIGIDEQFFQDGSVADDGYEALMRLNVARNDGTPGDSTINTILDIANNDTATGNQISVLNGIRLSGSNITNGINFNADTAGNTSSIKIPTLASGSCASGAAQGLVINNTAGAQVGHICVETSGGTPLKYYAGAFNTSGTDIAEQYSTREEDRLEPGDVVQFDAVGNLVVAKTTSAYSSKIVGVISNEPGITLSGTDETTGKTDTVNGKPVALKGRVPVKVTDENGPIGVGDYLTSSSTPGYAMRATHSGMVIGRALDPFDGPGEGKIRMFVEIGPLGEASGLAPTTTLNPESFSLDSHMPILTDITSLTGRDGSWSVDSQGHLTVQAVSSEVYKVKTTTFTHTVGQGMLSAGGSSYTVANNQVNSQSKIFVTFRQNPGVKWWVSDVGDGYFTVQTDSPAIQDAKFDYWIIGVDDQGNNAAIPTIEPTPTPAPPDEPAPSDPEPSPAPVEPTQ